MNVSKTAFKYRIALSALATITLLLIGSPSQAEGGNKRPPTGDWGVNRRVITKEGYVEIEGQFNLTFEFPKNADGKLTPGPYGNVPSPYVGGFGPSASGGEDHVDAGFLYHSDEINNAPKGWDYMIRLNSANGVDGSCPVNYWDAATQQSVVWRSGPANSLNAFLNFRVYGGDVTTTSAKEEPGWMSITVDQLPGGNREIVYWSTDGDASLTPTLTTNLKAQALQGSTRVQLDSVGGAWTLDVLRVGTETVTISSKPDSNNNVTVIPAFALNHPVGEKVTLLQYSRKAYPSHLAAPWSGQPAFSPNVFANLRVKRIIGMTRNTDRTDELDDSSLTCTFSEGQVRGRNESALRSFKEADVEQGGATDKRFTGYDTRPNNWANDGEWDKRTVMPGRQSRQSDSRTIVEFPNLTIPNLSQSQANVEGRTNSPRSRNATEGAAQESRYIRETVRINLRDGSIKIIGMAAVLGGQSSLP